MRFLFVTTNKLLSKGIQAFEGDTASHVGLSFREGSVIDSVMFHGVRLNNEARWLSEPGRILIDSIEVLLPDEKAAEDYAMSRIGNAYDYGGFLGFTLWRDMQHPNKDYCSELGRNCWLHGGLTLPDRSGRSGVRLLRVITHTYREARRSLENKGQS